MALGQREGQLLEAEARAATTADQPTSGAVVEVESV